MAYYARCVQILADTARVLGKHVDVEPEAVAAMFAEHYFDEDGKLQNAAETQTAYLLAIAFDLIPARQQVGAAENLVRLVDDADGHLRTGFLGTPYIVSILDRMGYTELAYSILFKETYPGWFFSINQGATTMWERWDSYTHEEGFGDAAMNSFNHYAYGAIGQWMVERIAGLAPDPAYPGYKHFFIRPQPGGPLEWARAELETPYGKASSGWKKENGILTLEITVPPNASATVEFPDEHAPETLSSGTFRFSIKCEDSGLLEESRNLQFS
jgi:alpha-L-rhamnosidase